MRAPIRRVSPKQAARTRAIAKLKKQWIAREFEREGFARCQGPCQRAIYDPHDASLLLSAHHIIHRSQGGTDDPINLSMMCRECHRKAHLGDGV